MTTRLTNDTTGRIDSYFKEITGGNEEAMRLLWAGFRARLETVNRRGRRQDQCPTFPSAADIAFCWLWVPYDEARKKIEVGKPCRLYGLEDVGLVINLAPVLPEFETAKMEVWISATAFTLEDVELERAILAADSFWGQRMKGLKVGGADFPPPKPWPAPPPVFVQEELFGPTGDLPDTKRRSTSKRAIA